MAGSIYRKTPEAIRDRSVAYGKIARGVSQAGPYGNMFGIGKKPAGPVRKKAPKPK